MTTPLDIVLADSHVVFLDVMRAALSHLGHRIASAVTTRSGLVAEVRQRRPAICITENRFADGAVVDVLEQLVTWSPATKTIVLTADNNPETLRQALNAGAVAYVHKTQGLAVLLDVMRRAASGELAIEGSFSGQRPCNSQLPLELRRLAQCMTHRELECLALLAEGLDTAAIARRLGISGTTVRSHVQALLTKLGVHSRLEAASLAIRYGLVSTPPIELLPASPVLVRSGHSW